jgi:hypothetical protein
LKLSKDLINSRGDLNPTRNEDISLNNPSFFHPRISVDQKSLRAVAEHLLLGLSTAQRRLVYAFIEEKEYSKKEKA